VSSEENDNKPTTTSGKFCFVLFTSFIIYSSIHLLVSSKSSVAKVLDSDGEDRFDSVSAKKSIHTYLLLTLTKIRI
jgi:hypothetical protein